MLAHVPCDNYSRLKKLLEHEMSDVNHPKHYNQGKIEVIEFIEDKKLGFNRGNAVKYIARAGVKDPSKEIEDLEKARWYVNREVEILRSEKQKCEDVNRLLRWPYKDFTEKPLPQKDFKFPRRTAQEIQEDMNTIIQRTVEKTNKHPEIIYLSREEFNTYKDSVDFTLHTDSYGWYLGVLVVVQK